MEATCLDSRRTVVVSGVPSVLSVSRMIDKVTIHFQSSRRSGGGDVEVVKYPNNMDGVAFVTFDEAQGKWLQLQSVSVATHYRVSHVKHLGASR